MVVVFGYRDKSGGFLAKDSTGAIKSTSVSEYGHSGLSHDNMLLTHRGETRGLDCVPISWP